MYEHCTWKVFSILISYFSEKERHSEVQHYKSPTFNAVNSKTLFDYITQLFKMNKSVYIA